MRDILDEEFTSAFGKNKETAINNAWEKLKDDAGSVICELTFDNGTDVTKTSFKKALINNENDEDGIYITPYHLYAKLIKIPNEI